MAQGGSRNDRDPYPSPTPLLDAGRLDVPKTPQPLLGYGRPRPVGPRSGKLRRVDGKLRSRAGTLIGLAVILGALATRSRGARYCLCGDERTGRCLP